MDIGGSLISISLFSIFLGLAFTLLSYLALVCYDVIALWKVGAIIDLKMIALTAFSSFALSFNLGIPLITGPGLRYHFYGRKMIAVTQIAHITLINVITFWIGIVMSLAISLVASTRSLSNIDNIPAYIHPIIGYILVATFILFCFWIELTKFKINFHDYEFILPGSRVAITQLIIGVAEVFSASAALFILLPPNIMLNYYDFTSIYVVASMVGAISNVPGGIGVFELIIIQAVYRISDVNIVANLIAFRIIYYFIPFILAVIVLIRNEWPRLWAFIRTR